MSDKNKILSLLQTAQDALFDAEVILSNTKTSKDNAEGLSAALDNIISANDSLNIVLTSEWWR